MRFGPEGDPRQRRAYVHTILARASKSLLVDDFLIAKRAVQNAGTSKLTRASHFEQDLAGIERKIVPDVTLQNNTETRLLRSVAYAFGSSLAGINFQDIFGRSSTSSADRELAEQLRPHAEVLNNALPNNGLRNPVTPGSYIAYIAAGRDAQKLVDMTFLVALQPEIPVPAHDNVLPLSKSNEVSKAKLVNSTIHQARLMAEIMLERFDNTDQTGTKIPPPTTVLSERYLAERGQMRESIIPYMRTFKDNLEEEYLDVLGGQSRSLIDFKQHGYNLNDAIAYLDIYRVTHPGLPWYDTKSESFLGPRRVKETTSPDEVVARLRNAKPRYSTEYGNALSNFADELAVTFEALREVPEAPINLRLPIGGGYERDGYSQEIMHQIVGNGDRAVRSLRTELNEGVQSQTTHPIPGTNLFMVITAFYRGPHEQLIGDHAPRFLAGLKWQRNVVSSHYLTPSVKRAFDISTARRAA